MDSNLKKTINTISTIWILYVLLLFINKTAFHNNLFSKEVIVFATGIGALLLIRPLAKFQEKRHLLLTLPCLIIVFIQLSTGPMLAMGFLQMAKLLALSLSVSIIEEAVFRGIFTKEEVLSKKTVEILLFVIPLLFAAAHIDTVASLSYLPFTSVSYLVYLYMSGLAFSYLTLISGSLVPGIVAHWMINFSGALTGVETQQNPLGIIGIAATVMAGYCLFLGGVYRKRRY